MRRRLPRGRCAADASSRPSPGSLPRLSNQTGPPSPALRDAHRQVRSDAHELRPKKRSQKPPSGSGSARTSTMGPRRSAGLIPPDQSVLCPGMLQHPTDRAGGGCSSTTRTVLTAPVQRHLIEIWDTVRSSDHA